jgi:hypothetical protein
MPTTNTNQTSTLAPAMTTEPEDSPAEGTSELPSKLVNYDPPVSGGSGPS